MSRSIKYKIMLATMGVTLASILVMFTIVLFSINDLVGKFLALNEQQNNVTIENINKTANDSKDKITSYINDTVVKRTENQLRRDFLVLKEPFVENSFGWVGRFLQNTFELDEEVIHASFIAKQNGELMLWYFVDENNPKGIVLGKYNYNFDSRSWEIESNGRETFIYDPYLEEIINSRGLRIESKTLTDPNSGTSKSIYDVSIPIFDGELDEFDEFKEDNEPIAFLHYQFSLEKVQALIRSEEMQLDVALKKQKDIAAGLASTTAGIGSTVKRNSFIIVGLSVVAILIAGFIIINLLSKRIIQPVLTLCKSAEVIANGEYNLPVKAQANDEIGLLSANFETMRLRIKQFTEHLQELVDERTSKLRLALKEVEREKQKVSEILEQIEQGIVTFNEDLVISPQYSLFIERFYGKEKSELIGKDVIATLFPDNNLGADDRDKLLQSLLCSIGQDTLNWHANAKHFPREMQISLNGEEKILAIDWTPIESEGIIERVMLSIRDLTEQRIHEKRAKQADERNKQVMEVISQFLKGNKNRLAQFLKSVKTSYIPLLTLPAELNLETMQPLMHLLHTIKGEARSLGFHTICNIIHEAESLGQSLVEGAASKGDINKDFAARLASASEVLHFYGKIFQMLSDHDELDTDKSISLLSVVERYVPEIKRYAQSRLFQIASIECCDEIIYWKPDAIEHLRTFILHTLSNTIDHGYVLPSERGVQVSKNIRIKIDARRDNDQLELSICDEGAGLSLDKINSLVEKRKFTPIADQDIYDVLFIDGVTTTDKASLRSGRGIGLAAVEDLARSLGGSARIRPLEPSGTKVSIKVPLHQMELVMENCRDSLVS